MGRLFDPQRSTATEFFHQTVKVRYLIQAVDAILALPYKLNMIYHCHLDYVCWGLLEVRQQFEG